MQGSTLGWMLGSMLDALSASMRYPAKAFQWTLQLAFQPAGQSSPTHPKIFRHVLNTGAHRLNRCQQLFGAATELSCPVTQVVVVRQINRCTDVFGG